MTTKATDQQAATFVPDEQTAPTAPSRARHLADATALPLITRIDERSGASVRMWAGVNCAPIEWAAFL